MPRFVVLIHDHPFLHWDFMLEKEASLRTWRLLQHPTSANPIVAESLPNHRLAYLDYEGPVSGNRGTVQAFDRGLYTIVDESSETLVLDLRGTKLQGRAILRKSAGSAAAGFEFRFEPSEGPANAD